MAGQVGFKTEVTPGTIVTPTKFLAANAASQQYDPGMMWSEGILASRYVRKPGQLGAIKAGGNIGLDLPNGDGIATLLTHMFGSVATLGAGPYTHTYTPGTPVGKSLTIQTGAEDSTGAVVPFTASGCKFTGWELSCAVENFAKLSLDFDALNIVDSTAIAAASYTSTSLFTFVQCAVTLNAVSVASARAVTLRHGKNMRVNRHRLGSRVANQQLPEGWFDFGGTITADFDGLAIFDLMESGANVALLLVFSNGVDSLTITCSVQVHGDIPNLTGRGLEEQTINFTASHATADASAITAVLINGEASAA